MSGEFRVLIAGGGVAGLEAMLALRELAGDRVQMTVLAPNEHFVYRPLAVREPDEPLEQHRGVVLVVLGHSSRHRPLIVGHGRYTFKIETISRAESS